MLISCFKYKPKSGVKLKINMRAVLGLIDHLSRTVRGFNGPIP